MLTRVDRIQLSTRDRGHALECWTRLVEAERVREDRVAALGALRCVLRVGESEVELLEPDGAGEIGDHLAATGGGLYAAGLATPDLAALRSELESRGVAHLSEGEQLFVEPGALGIPGLRLVLSELRERDPAGLLRFLYEVTHLTADAAGDAKRLAELFALDPGNFVPIESETYGYAGVLTLFRSGSLDRIETITPDQSDRTMPRFFRRRGPTLYMCYAETDRPAAVRERALEYAPRAWTGDRDGAVPDNLFLHPAALGGVMLGVSRTSVAWSWSGSPERVR